jgi:hypothetical protein
MLIEAFLSEAIAEIPLQPVAEDFSTHVRQWLAGHIDQQADGAGS